jgi:phosphoserine phosphatase
MSIDEDKLEELEAQVSELRKERNSLFELIKKVRDERDNFNKSAQAIREQAQRHREERDRINFKVQEIKKNLGPLFDELAEKNQALARTDRVIREEYSGLPNKNKLKKDLNRIEWEVMTTPTMEMLGREDELIQRASKLRKTLEEFKEIDLKRDKKLDYLADKKNIKVEINAMRDEINSLAKQSQEHHEKMILLYEQADKEKQKADEAHGRYVEKIREVEQVKAQINIIIPVIQALRNGLKASRKNINELRRLSTQQRVEAMKQEAIRKMESGEKLSFEDLKLIYGDEENEEK